MTINDSAQLTLAPPPPDETAQVIAKARAWIGAILADIEGAPRMPWTDQELLRNTTLMRQMPNWLPPEEAADVRARFAAALALLGRSAR